MTNSALIDKETLGRMRAMLAALPPKPKSRFSSREAVAEMADDIRRARDTLGYSLEDIALMLGEHGHDIKPGTLRGYLRDLEKAESTRKTRRRKVTAAASDTHAAPDEEDDIERLLAAAAAARASDRHDG
jgi:hypothetical protein